MVIDATLDAKDFSSKEWSSKKLKNSNTRDVITFASVAALGIVQEQTAMSASMSQEELHYLPDEILNATEIQPGQSYRGKAYLPFTKDKYIRLIIPLGSNDFSCRVVSLRASATVSRFPHRVMAGTRLHPSSF